MTTTADSRSPSMVEAIRRLVDNRLLDLHVAMPARVESYDVAKQEVDVKPLIKSLISDIDGKEILERLPVIPDVPIIFSRTRQAGVTLPIKKGDHVLLIFNEQSIDTFVAGTGAEVSPDDFKRNDLTDAVAFCGFYPEAKSIAADPDDVVVGFFGDNEAKIHVSKDLINLFEKSAVSFLARSDRTDARFASFEGDYDIHQHSGALIPGPPTSPPLVPRKPVTSTAADKVKGT